MSECIGECGMHSSTCTHHDATRAGYDGVSVVDVASAGVNNHTRASSYAAHDRTSLAPPSHPTQVEHPDVRCGRTIHHLSSHHDQTGAHSDCRVVTALGGSGEGRQRDLGVF